MPRSATTRKRKAVTRRKPTLRKAIASSKAAAKRALQKGGARSKATASKATRRKVTVSKATVSRAHKPTEPRDHMDRVERNLREVSDDHKVTKAILKEVAALQKENAAGLKETRTNLDQLGVEVKQLGSNLDQLGIKVDKTVAGIRELRQSIGGLDSKWGDFSEALLIGDVKKALNEFEGIAVTSRHPNAEHTYEGKTWEIDCIAAGADMVVVIEAKASLTKGHVGKFIGNILERFTLMAPEYRGRKIYGAVGYLNAKDDVVAFAQSKGLLVLRSVHETKEVVGVPSKFKLRNFHP